MDKTTKLFAIFVIGLAVFAFSRQLILTLITSFWLIFLFFSLPYQIFLFNSLFLLFYYLFFKNISLFYPVFMVALGLVLAVLPAPKEKNFTLNNFISDTRALVLIVLTAFFIFALAFSYQTYQKQQKVSKETEKPTSAQKVIINLNR